MSYQKPSVPTSIHILLLLNLLCLLLITGGYFLLSAQQQKIGYVDADQLLEGYLGIKDASMYNHAKVSKRQHKLDTLNCHLDEVHIRCQTKLKYLSTITQDNAQQPEQIRGELLKHINHFVIKYGQRHGYDIILGTTSKGSLLYSNRTLDITQQLLNELNITHNPGILPPSRQGVSNYQSDE